MKKALTATVLAFSMLVPASSLAADKKVRIGVEGAYPPFSLVDSDGDLQGFDIDIAEALCVAMNAECTLVTQDWDGIIPALLARKYDAIIASMSITEERKQKVDFSDKYYQTPARFARRKGSGIEITQEGVQGKSVGVQRATVTDTFLTDNFGDAVEIKRYGTLDEAVLDMTSGRIDLILADSVVLSEAFLDTEKGADFEFIGPAYTDARWFGEGIGIAVRKGDDELREAFNAAIKSIRENGTYQAISDEYFEFDIYGD